MVFMSVMKWYVCSRGSMMSANSQEGHHFLRPSGPIMNQLLPGAPKSFSSLRMAQPDLDLFVVKLFAYAIMDFVVIELMEEVAGVKGGDEG